MEKAVQISSVVVDLLFGLSVGAAKFKFLFAYQFGMMQPASAMTSSAHVDR